MMGLSTDIYTLVASELASFRSLISFQAAHTLDGGAVTPDNLDAFVASVDTLSANVDAVKNERAKLYFEDVYKSLLAIGSVNAYSFLQIYIMTQYALFLRGVPKMFIAGTAPNAEWVREANLTLWNGFRHNLLDIVDRCDIDPNKKDYPTYPGWVVPTSPQLWSSAIVAQLASWGDQPDKHFIDIWGESASDGPCRWIDSAKSYTAQSSRAHTWLTSWPSSTPHIIQQLAPVWAAQKQDVLALLAADTLTAEEYFFLLYLLPALVTGDAASQQLAARIVSAPAESPEYPNDAFGNQLVYLALMYLADPLGPFGWPNQQLQAALKDLGSVITQGDPASVALRTSLGQHEKILVSDTAYPMQDPYTNVDFTQRKTDTLFALDKARASLRT
jgi:hypothetical protein